MAHMVNRLNQAEDDALSVRSYESHCRRGETVVQYFFRLFVIFLLFDGQSCYEIRMDMSSYRQCRLRTPRKFRNDDGH